MMESSTIPGRTATEADRAEDYHTLTDSVAAFATGGVVFFTTSAVFLVFGGTPPSSTPVATVVGHTGWFVGSAFLAVGTVALVRGTDSLKTGLAGHLSVGALGLGTFSGLQWATWAWMDVLAARHDQYDVALETVIAPFGAGLSVMYGLLVGGGIAFLGWWTLRTGITDQFVGWAGVVVGTIAVLGNGAVLLSAGKDALFAGVVLVHPLYYLWGLVFAADLYRRQS